MDRIIDWLGSVLVRHFTSAEEYIRFVFYHKSFRVVAKAAIISLFVFLIAFLTALFLWAMTDSDGSSYSNRLEMTREWRITEQKISDRKKYYDSLRKIDFEKVWQRDSLEVAILKKIHQLDTLKFYVDSLKTKIK